MGTIGAVSNPDNMNEVIGKAGRNVHKGWRPHVRGVAMNPVDHPHGGGEGKTSGGRHPVTPWGKKTRGPKTRRNKSTDRLIVRVLEDRDPDVDLDLRVTRDGALYKIEAMAVRFEAVLGETSFTVVADRLPEHQRLALLSASAASTLADAAVSAARAEAVLARVAARQ
jgi:hypothetical protein